MHAIFISLCAHCKRCETQGHHLHAIYYISLDFYYTFAYFAFNSFISIRIEIRICMNGKTSIIYIIVHKHMYTYTNFYRYVYISSAVYSVCHLVATLQALTRSNMQQTIFLLTCGHNIYIIQVKYIWCLTFINKPSKGYSKSSTEILFFANNHDSA